MSTALDKAREAMAAKRAAGIAIERLDPISKAARSPRSLRLAITAKCWDCQGAGADPGTRERIATCCAISCPLHNVRPYQG